ncbi:MAG: hypothetical protein DHS20C15_29640 [Planctomycetota bacterium]|nr:MAG: hypothetical protein DHS20C15_29640 [Planctomycetota bacterium]
MRICSLFVILAFATACSVSTTSRRPASVARADANWSERLIDPVTAPFLWESPVVHSSVQPVFLRHEFPGTSILGGGNLRGYALQLRYAINERLAFIATKDGYIDFNPGGPDSSGWGDVAGGLKYVVHEDEDAGELVSVGFTYEGASGSRDVFQGNGEGVWHPFVSAGWDNGDSNALAGVGAYLPVDGDAEASFIDYHLQFSWELDDGLVPLVEVNGIHYTNNARALPVNQDGVDYGSVGAANVAGNDIITGALGLRWRWSQSTDFGVAFEDTLTAREDIFGARLTMDMIHRF